MRMGRVWHALERGQFCCARAPPRIPLSVPQTGGTNLLALHEATRTPATSRRSRAQRADAPA